MARSGVVRVCWILVLVAAAVLLRAAPAQAVGGPKERPEGEPATSRVLQFGLGGEYGVKLAGPKLNPWAFGFGVSIGYTLPVGVYVGVPFDYFFGSEEATGTTGFNAELRLWQFGVEGGYDLALGREVVLRGKVGLGYAFVHDQHCEGDVCSSGSSGKPAFGPGLAFLYLGPSFSFTFDARYQLVPTDPLAQGLLFSLGFGF
jgi:hypothetical protein